MITALIVTHDSAKVIPACLEALQRQTSPFDEVLLIDNGSRDDTLAVVRAGFGFVRCTGNPANIGFSAAINQGIRQCLGSYVVLINPDVELRDDFVEKLKAAIASFAALPVGMFVPKLLTPEGRIDSTGIVLTWLRRFYDRGRGGPDIPDRFTGRGIIGPSGACAVYVRKLLEDIRVGDEYFDEDFFLIAEDVDVAWRAQRRGWKAWYEPALVAVHRGGISRRRSPEAQFYAFRNRYYLIIKNESPAELFRLLLAGWIYDIPRLIVFLCVNPQGFLALRQIISTGCAMVRKRKKFMERVRSSPEV